MYIHYTGFDTPLRFMVSCANLSDFKLLSENTIKFAMVMAKIFLSHIHDEIKPGRSITRSLEKLGHSVISIHPDQRWQENLFASIAAVGINPDLVV